MITEFTPLLSLAGGALIGLSAVLLMAFNGRIAGISGIVSRLFPPYEDGGLAVRLAFVAGLMGAPLLVMAAMGRQPEHVASSNVALMAIAGAFVGFGSVFGSGCTSGHGVCGLSRLSTRSLVATITFMATAALVVVVSRHVVGG